VTGKSDGLSTKEARLSSMKDRDESSTE